MTYRASCHCGAVAVEVDADIPDEAIECNCSHCQNKGLLLTAVGGDQIKLVSGADKVRTYQFNKHAIDHQFCPDCGSEPYATGKGRDGTAMAMVNLRCVPEANIEAIKRQKYDGASL